jgi:hypothetical protein
VQFIQEQLKILFGMPLPVTVLSCHPQKLYPCTDNQAKNKVGKLGFELFLG